MKTEDFKPEKKEGRYKSTYKPKEKRNENSFERRPKRDFEAKNSDFKRERTENSFRKRPKSEFDNNDYNFKKKPFENRQNRDEKREKGGVRLAKRLAELGVASRRDCEKIITDGKVKVNGIDTVDLSLLVTYDDEISVNGKALVNKKIETKIYLINKPSGYVTTNFDPQGRKTLFELVPAKFGRLMTIGRLDINTEGLILLTNNGEAARILELPSTGLKRVYRVRVFGEVKESEMESLKNGITIDGINYGKFVVLINEKKGANTWLTVIIHEGKNREIKKVLGHFNLKVTRLIRIQYGPYKLDDLPSGCIAESKFKFDISFYEKRNKRFNSKEPPSSKKISF